jgi:hypothetical protein
VRSLNQRSNPAARRSTRSQSGSQRAGRLRQIPGVGPLVATATVAAIGNRAAFHTGREFAAWLRLIPRQHSTTSFLLPGKSNRSLVVLTVEYVPSRLLLSDNEGVVAYIFHGTSTVADWLLLLSCVSVPSLPFQEMPRNLCHGRDSDASTLRATFVLSVVWRRVCLRTSCYGRRAFAANARRRATVSSLAIPNLFCMISGATAATNCWVSMGWRVVTYGCRYAVGGVGIFPYYTGGNPNSVKSTELKECPRAPTQDRCSWCARLESLTLFASAFST